MAVVESARPSATLDSASVERVAAFLTHESTQSTPLSERIAFLRQKGISSDDIAAALRKTGLSQPSAATATSEVASSSPPWASRLATVLAVVASGAALNISHGECSQSHRQQRFSQKTKDKSGAVASDWAGNRRGSWHAQREGRRS